ncbi:MAG: gluconokinase [Desulfurococcus sp.]|uniref:gluconokinase n=1 Tax=Desulfurococcus sp. TaxID=51678 RepID=UPI003162C406
MLRIISIDLGTTNIKGAFIEFSDSSMNVNIVEQVNIKQRHIEDKAGGIYEHDPRYILSNIENIIRHLSFSHGKPDAVVFSSYLFSALFMTSMGEYKSNIITWVDERSKVVLYEISRYGAELYRRTGCPPLHIYSLPKILYFKKMHPSIISNDCYILDSKSFLMNYFVGYPVTDYSTASGTYQLLNIRKLRWDDLALEIAGIDEKQLPILREGDFSDYMRTGIALKTGITEKTPVVLGLYDGAAMIYGLTGGRDRIAVVNIGTSGMIRSISDTPVIDESGYMRFQTYYFYRNTWIPGGGINNAGIVLNYIADLLGMNMENIVKNLEEYSSEVYRDEKILEDAPYVIPLLYDERIPHLSGMGLNIIGLKPTARLSSLLGSIIEGIVFLLSLFTESLEENNIVFNEVRLAGKIASISLTPLMISNMFSKPVRYTDIPDVSHIGNALIVLSSLNYASRKNIEELIENNYMKHGVNPSPGLATILGRRRAFMKEFVKRLLPV